MRAVVLSSGGVDSSVLMKLLLTKKCTVFPLFVDYGQRAADVEWATCQKICNHLELKPKKMNISGFGRLVPSGLTDEKMDIEKEAFLPTRNLLFLTVAAAYGYRKGAHTVAIGLLANPIFPDQTEIFLKNTEKLLSEAIGEEITVFAPFINMDKTDTIRLARKYDVPLNSTYSCHAGGIKPCGKCISCKEKIAALKTIDK
jgi:7-cyano-7-deazaguanine synthase